MGIGCLVCIVNLLFAPVENVLMLMAVKVKEPRILVGSDFFNPGNYHRESHTCTW